MTDKEKVLDLERAIAEVREEIVLLKEDFDEAYASLTETEQKAFRGGRCPTKELEEICEDLDNCEDELAELEEELKAIKKQMA